MSIFSVSRLAPRPHVYAMVCQDQAGPTYIKFGKTCNVGGRLLQLQTACPIPPKYYCVLEVPGDAIAATVEKQLHKVFSERRTNGEWFRFNIDDDADKEDFRTGCRYVFRMFIPGWKQTWWTIIDAPAVIAAMRAKAARFLHTKDFKKKAAAETRERRFKSRHGIT